MKIPVPLHNELKAYERKLNSKDDQPYIHKLTINHHIGYNPNYGDDKICECGHTYYRHFDSYEKMDACGCKYCQCFEFKLKKEIND